MTNTKTHTKPLVPQLRFKEFDGEWEKKKLGEITKINQGLQIAIKDRFLEEVENSFFYITNEFLRAGSTKKYFIKNPTESVLCTEEDILMTRTGNTGQVVTGVRGAFHNNFFKIKITSSINKWFFFYFLTDYKTQNEILKLAGTSTIPDLNHSDFYRLKINLPSLKEQQKIAKFLTAVDDKISQLTSKKEQLTKYKKGVMQQLFPSAGSGQVPELRFKDENGNDFADWKEKRLGELTYKVGKKNKENIQYPIYSINNQEGFLPQSEQFDGLDSNDRGYDISLYKIVESKTFAYNPARINVGSIGYSNDLKKVIVSSLYVCFKTNEELDDQYLLVYLDSYNFQKDILRFQEGGVRQYLFYENFCMIKIPIPSLKEQQKIASYLSRLDDKIEAVQIQIEQTQEFKKGLLQQLFV